MFLMQDSNYSQLFSIDIRDIAADRDNSAKTHSFSKYACPWKIFKLRLQKFSSSKHKTSSALHIFSQSKTGMQEGFPLRIYDKFSSQSLKQNYANQEHYTSKEHHSSPKAQLANFSENIHLFICQVGDPQTFTYSFFI